jgi:hypothetical protein
VNYKLLVRNYIFIIVDLELYNNLLCVSKKKKKKKRKAKKKKWVQYNNMLKKEVIHICLTKIKFIINVIK